jgi:hypothetical protein
MLSTLKNMITAPRSAQRDTLREAIAASADAERELASARDQVQRLLQVGPAVVVDPPEVVALRARAQETARVRDAADQATRALQLAQKNAEACAVETIFAETQPLRDRLQRLADSIPQILDDVRKLVALSYLAPGRCTPLIAELRKLQPMFSQETPLIFHPLVKKLAADPEASIEQP